MSHVKNKNTKPEVLVRKALFRQGFRYRINDKRIVGKPDIVLKKYHTVVFINGCFWHNHSNCKKASIPKTNFGFWKAKIDNNVCRDAENKKKLQEQGWKVLVVWECELTKSRFEETMNTLANNIRND